MPSPEVRRQRLRDWYIEHDVENQEKRTRLYHENPEVRELKITRSKEYREKRKAGAKVERIYHRQYKGKEVQAFSAGHAADCAGTYLQMVINFEKRGWIPKSIFGEKHRLYLDRQVRLIVKAYEYYTLLTASNIPRRALNASMVDNCKRITEEWD